jgi:hypothetical protein
MSRCSRCRAGLNTNRGIRDCDAMISSDVVLEGGSGSRGAAGIFIISLRGVAGLRIGFGVLGAVVFDVAGSAAAVTRVR